MSVGKGVVNKKKLVEKCLRLDLLDLSDKINFESNIEATVGWQIGIGNKAMIGLKIYAGKQLALFYYLPTTDSSKRDSVRLYIDLEATDCYFGGKRWWFRCPSCGRRCRILYLPPFENKFACRLCHNLTYRSQQEGSCRSILQKLFGA